RPRPSQPGGRGGVRSRHAHGGRVAADLEGARMNRVVRLSLAAVLAVLAMAAQAIVVTDERGVSVDLPKSPQRIVTLLPSLTESVCTLGACDRLVGVERYSNWPAPVRSLPQVGAGIDLNVEAVVALKPDVVLLAKSSRVTERLEALGVKVVVLEPKNHADV